MYSCRPLHKNEQRQDDQLEPTYSSSVLIWDVTFHDLLEVIDDREGWWEGFRNIRADGATWQWWYIYIYIYNYNYEWRNWYIKLEITVTRKSGTHLHVTYGALNSCFDLIRSHQQCIPWSPPLEIKATNAVCRSQNSTTGPLVHATYKRYRINKWPCPL